MSMNQKIETLLGYVLLIGTLISALLVTIGGCFFLYEHGNENLNIQLTQAGIYQTTVVQIWHAAFSFTSIGIIQFGLLLLVLTQLLRVGLLVWFYGVIKDYWFMWISLFIFLVLVYSLIWRQ